MKIHYCDRCGIPLKNGEKTYLVIIPEVEFGKTIYGNMSLENSIEVCTECLELIKKVLNEREKGIEELTQSIKESFKMKIKKTKRTIRKHKKK